MVIAVLMVDVAGVFGASERLEGFAEIEKSLAGGAVPQLGNLKLAMRVTQLKEPLLGRYSFVYQKVQPSAGSTEMLL